VLLTCLALRQMQVSFCYFRVTGKVGVVYFSRVSMSIKCQDKSWGWDVCIRLVWVGRPYCNREAERGQAARTVHKALNLT